MRVYCYEGEKTLTELVNKLYKIRRKGLTSAAVGRQLAQANPRHNLTGKALSKNVTMGTRIAVPDIEGADHTAASKPLRDDVVDALTTDKVLDSVRAAIISARDREAERLKEHIRTAETVAAQVQDKDILAGIEKTRADMDQQFARLDDNTRSMLDSVEKARQVLGRQRELLKRT